jgi:hypothetical protein
VNIFIIVIISQGLYIGVGIAPVLNLISPRIQIISKTMKDHHANLNTPEKENRAANFQKGSPSLMCNEDPS